MSFPLSNAALLVTLLNPELTLTASDYFALIGAILERSQRNGPGASAVILYLLLSLRTTAGFAMLQIIDIIKSVNKAVLQITNFGTISLCKLNSVIYIWYRQTLKLQFFLTLETAS